MDVQRFWKLIEDARAQVADLAGGEAVAAQAVVVLAAFPPGEIIAAQRVLSGLMAGSYRMLLWAAAYVINGGCSDDGFDYFRGWLIIQGQDVFELAVADPDALTAVAAVRSAAARRAFAECESALYIPARAYRAATGGELPAGAYVARPSGPVGDWDSSFDDRAEMKRRLPRLTALCWPDGAGSRGG